MPKKTFAAALATGNHLLVQLKNNQAQLSDVVADIAAGAAPADTASSQNDGRSRREYRTVEVFPAANALVPTEWAPFIQTMDHPAWVTQIMDAGRQAGRDSKPLLNLTQRQQPTIRGHAGRIETRHDRLTADG